MKGRPIFLVVFLAALGGLVLWWTNQATVGAGRGGERSRPERKASAPSEASPGSSSRSGEGSGAVRLWGNTVRVAGQPASSPGQVPVGRTALFEWDQASLQKLQRGSEIVIPLPGGREVAGRVNLVQKDGEIVRVGGGLVGGPAGSFSLSAGASDVGGRVLLPQEQLAYLVTAPTSGRVLMQELPISAVICYPFPADDAGQPNPAPPAAGPAPAPPELRSRPEAVSVLYLDFDGATVTDPDWNSGNTIEAAPSALNNTQITEVWYRVSEDFSPFNLNVTTAESDYNNAPVGRRMRVIITPTKDWYGNYGGVAFRDSFARAGTMVFVSDIPCWVFNTTTSDIAEAASHELGHTLGLQHDRNISAPEPHDSTNSDYEYYRGHGGSGPVSWGPIMGSTYTRTVVQWSKGEYAAAQNSEDDIAIISGSQPTPFSGATNSVGYVSDEAGNDRNSAVAINVSSGFPALAGVITTAADVDFYGFSVDAPKVVGVTANPAVAYPKQANLDILLELQDSAGNVLASSNPDQALNASLALGVVPGTYYVTIRGTGRANPATDGYSNYGSIGQYTLVGSLTAASAPAVTIHPNPATATAGVGVVFGAAAAGTPTPAYQWQRLPAGSGVWSDLGDGGIFAGANTASVFINPISLGMSGDQFRCRMTNFAGTVTTNPAMLTVTPATAPVFSVHPSNKTVTAGNSASFTASASGNPSPSYQWQRLPAGSSIWNNLSTGGIYSGVTSSSLTVTPTLAMDGDQFRCVATNTGGSASSNSATLTVLAAIVSLPVIEGSPSGVEAAELGAQLNLDVYATGTGPFNYQWYHNGLAIAGANSTRLTIPKTGGRDLGEYFATVSNPGGVAVTRTTSVQLLDDTVPPSYHWLKAVEMDGIVYFLFKEPAMIARFDLATEAWLPSWSLAQVPADFAIAADAIYIAFGSGVTRYDRTLAGAAPLVSTASALKAIEVIGNYLITIANNSSNTVFNSFNRTTGAAIGTKSVIYSLNSGYSYSSTTGRIYARRTAVTPQDITSLAIQANGTFGDASESPYHGTFLDARRTYVLGAGDLIADDSGVVYKGLDLTYVASLGGRLSDIIPSGTGGYYILRGGRISSTDSQFRETGATISSLPATRFWRKDSNLFVFVQPSAAFNTPAVEKVAISAIQPPALAPSVSESAKVWSPQMLVDDAGIVYVYSRIDRNIRRWSTRTGRYLSPIALSNNPNFLAYSSETKSLYFEDRAYQLRRIGLDGGDYRSAVQMVSALPVTGLETAGSRLFMLETNCYSVADPMGVVSFSTGFGGGGRWPMWSKGSQRMYWTYLSGLVYQGIDGAGAFAGFGFVGSAASRMVWPSPDGLLVVTDLGNIFFGNETDLRKLGALPHAIFDAAWSGDLFHSIRGIGANTEVKSWTTWNFQLLRTVTFSGSPERIFPISGGRLVLITTSSGNLTFRILRSTDLAEVNAAPPQPSDFNLDGRPDILLENAVSGQRVLWLMGGPNNQFVTQGLDLGFLDAAWRIVGLADFNQDGNPDILLENSTTGQRVLWLMGGPNNQFVTLGLDLGFLDPAWHIVGMADFNSDGGPDILLENTISGQRVLWLMGGPNNQFVTLGLDLGFLDPAWHIVGLADFNLDGKPDILLENTISGQRVLWLMGGPNNQFVTLGLDLGFLDPVWHIVSVTDFNADGNPDILLENTVSGQRVLWLMGGPNNQYVTLGLDLGFLDPAWRIVN